MTPRSPTILRCLATTDAVADADLLSRFVASRDQAAFELLVWRHAGMVLRVCRAVLGDHHAAEDACQATFLALARQAASVGRGEVAGWLYRVARRVALRAVTKRNRVRAGSTELLDHLPAPGPAEPDPTLIRALHEEVAGLPERYRVPVLLCFFGGLTHRAAADRLGLPIGTLATRVARARDRLLRRLSARGFGVSAGVLTAALTTGPATATPDFVSAAARSAIAFAAGSNPSVSAAVLKLAEGATRPMTKIRLAVGMIAVCGATALCGLLVAGGAEPPTPSPAKGAPAVASEPRPGFNVDEDKAVAEATKALQGTWEVREGEVGNPKRVENNLQVGARRTFGKDGTYKVEFMGTVIREGTWKVVAVKDKVVHLDMTVKQTEKAVVLGILEFVDADTVRLCITALRAEEKRPTKFEVTKGSLLRLFTLKRVKE